jgi:hypothetical protein
LREGGIGSTGGITISRDAMREISAGEFGTETLLRVPWGPDTKEDGIFKMGGIGSTGSISLSRDAIRELKGQVDDELPIKLPQLKEGGIGSTGGITISRDAIREISAGNFDTKEAIKVPWSAGAAEDGIFKKGGIGSIGGIALSRGAIKELKNSNVKSEMSPSGSITISRQATSGAGDNTGAAAYHARHWSADSQRPARDSAGAEAYHARHWKESSSAAVAPAAPKPEAKREPPEPPPPSLKSTAPAPVPKATAPAPKAKTVNPPPPSVDKPVTLGLASGVLGGSEGAKTVFGFLQTKSFSRDREGFILGDVFADGAFVFLVPMEIYRYITKCVCVCVVVCVCVCVCV